MGCGRILYEQPRLAALMNGCDFIPEIRIERWLQRVRCWSMAVDVGDLGKFCGYRSMDVR